MHILFWQNIPSIHQAPFLKALADLCLERFGTTITIICENDVSEKRKNMGWELPDFGNAKVIIQPNPKERQRLLEKNNSQDCCHIFTGFDMTPLNNKTLQAAISYSCKTGVYLEGPQSYPLIKKIIRKIKYSYFAHRYSAIDYLFPIGDQAVHYYTNCGFNEETTYPFAYFVQPPPEQANSQKKNSIIKFLYVGQNIHRKGVDIAIRAFENIPDQDWQFDCVGIPQEGYRQYNVSQALRSKTNFLGPIPNKDVKQKMASSDVLILPSRFDGWGAVVNEALLSGAKVIISSEAGAKDLVKNANWRGEIFKSRRVSHLKNAICTAIDQGPVNSSERKKIKQWAIQAIAPEQGAQYFLECLQHTAYEESSPKPKVPWT